MDSKITENQQIVQETEVKPKSKFTKTTTSLLFSHSINCIISVFVSTFLISYIYSISNNYVVDIAIFYLVNYFVMGIFYYIISKFIDKTNRVAFYRVAIVIRALFILIVVLANKNLAKLVALAGALHGFSEACYWTSYNIMKNELVSKSAVGSYSLFQHIVDKVVKIVIPVILGKIIDGDSFKVSAIIVLVVVVIQFIASMFIKSHRPENSSFDYKDFRNIVNNLGEKKVLIRNMALMSFIYGFISILAPLNTIFIMFTFNSNFSLGLLTSLFSVLSIIAMILFKKFTHSGKRSVWFYLSAFVPVIAVLVMVFVPNKTTLIIFNIVYEVLAVVYSLSFDVARNVVIKKLGMYDCIAEYQAMIEIALEIGRVVVFAIMLVVGIICASFGYSGIVISVKVLYAIMIFAVTALSIMLKKYEDKLLKFNI